MSRPQPVMTTVWSPEGRPERHTLQNAADLVRHLGWSRKNPVDEPSQKDPPKAGEPSQKEPQADAAASSRGVQLRATTTRLADLRAELESLGVTPDLRWGVRFLSAKIAAVREARGPRAAAVPVRVTHDPDREQSDENSPHVPADDPVREHVTDVDAPSE